MEDIEYLKGINTVLVSAPHSFNHVRNGITKKRDLGTLRLTKMLNKKLNTHSIYLCNDVMYDPNYDRNNIYKKEVRRIIRKNDIKYLIDLHGANIKHDVEIGTNNFKNISKEKIDIIIKIFNKYGINAIVDNYFKGSNKTISNVTNNYLKIETMQLEIAKKFRVCKYKSNEYKRMFNALYDICLYLDRSEKMKEINYIEKYDKILDIKPAYGYKREINREIIYNEIGLEIEVSVNYERDKYSFTGKMLKKVKNLIGDNGYFVKDGTVLGDYNFEIVLDPLNVDTIYNIYSQLMDIISFSEGVLEISRRKNCGIHLNFNKNDIKDKFLAHKKTSIFVSENPKYFYSNVYKQFKFIWDYDEYNEFQKNIADKYLWINYIKTKVVEIRNIKCDLNANELCTLLNELLNCLYSDKINSNEKKTYFHLNNLYNTVFNDESRNEILSDLSLDQFIVIGLKNGKAKAVKLTEEIKKQIMELI